MLDGKAVNAITNFQSKDCSICACPSAAIQNLSSDFTPIPGNLKFGIPTLHAKINTLRNILNVAYKLKFKEEILSLKQIKKNPKLRMFKKKQLNEKINKNITDILNKKDS